MPNLYSIHDEEGAFLVPPGGWCVALIELSQKPSGTDYTAIRPDVNWLIRASWGYGSTGTIPKREQTNEYVDALVYFASHSRGVYGFIIGNEPNHENERPDGLVIGFEHYSQCFVKSRSVLQSLVPGSLSIVAACAPYHANPTDWLHYYEGMLQSISRQGGADGLAIHAYTRGSKPGEIHSLERMGGALNGQYSGFYTYRDALSVVPNSMLNLPVFITEFDEYGPWEDRNTGVVQEAYRDIDIWNQSPGNQKIYCLTLYRYPDFDQWGFQGKPGVIQDFKEAVAMGLQSPTSHLEGSKLPSLVLPSIKKDKMPTDPLNSFHRELDPQALARGVNIVEMEGKENETVWKVKKVEWLDKEESQGRHHIYFETLDEKGNRVVGVPILISWPTGNHVVTSEEKKGEPYSANYPMSPSRNEFSALVQGDGLSEMVRGIGMGADLGSGFNAGEHTSTVVTFQKVKGKKGDKTPETAKIPQLFYPIQDVLKRRITQKFGENPESYKRFGLAGHTGIDFGAPVGTVIHAIDAGRIQESGFDESGYGEYIKIIHTWGESLYAHLSRRSLVAGDTASRGQVIGFSGNTGNSTGPHLHFAIRIYPYKRGAPYDGYSDPLPHLGNVSPSPRPTPTKDILGAIKEAARETGLEWQLLASLAWAESSFRPELEDGLFQIGDATWSDWSPIAGATDINDPLDNARVAAYYLRWLMGQLNGNLYRTLMAYNFGIGNILENIEPPSLTIEYVNKVIHGRDLLKAIGA